MKVGLQNFQEGGPMPAGDPAAQAPAQEPMPQEAPQEQNPLIQIAQVAMQALQTGDCQAALQVCEAFIQLIQQSSAEPTPQAAPEGEPVYRKGGILARRIKK